MFFFQVLLANKLDGDILINYTAVAAPLIVSHVTLIFMSFSAKGGNKCKANFSLLPSCLIIKYVNFSGWFGMRKDFSHFLLGLCPLLQEYGNISYQSRSDQEQPTSEPMVSEKSDKHIKKMDFCKPVVPIISIDTPD